MNMPLVLLNRRRRGGSFSPYSLFSGTSIGTWFDPSDLSTMYQDAAGTTAVTTPGQPVGLRLDKSQGLALGAELVEPIDFTTGWTFSGSAVTFDDANTYTAAGVANVFRAYFTVGKWYKMEISVTTTGGAILLFNGNAAVNPIGPASLVNGVASTFYFYAAATQLNIRTPNAATVNVDNISVRELAGNHATQSVLASRPTYGIEPAGGRRNLLTWSEGFDNAAWVKSNTTVTANAAVAPDGTTTAETLLNAATAAAQVTQQNIAVPSGISTYSTYCKAGTVNFVSLRTSGFDADITSSFNLSSGAVFSQGAGHTASITPAGSGWYRCVVSFSTASDLIGNVHAYLSADGGSVFDADLGANGTSSIYLWGAQLELGSTATAYQRVTNAFDVTEAGVQTCHYVQYDGSDDGMITNSIDFTATDKMSVFAGVRKLSDAVAGIIVELSPTVDSNNGSLAVASGTLIYNISNKGTTARSAPSPASYAAPMTNIVSGLGDISGDIVALRVNGVQVAQSALDQGTGNYGNYPLYLGRRNNGAVPPAYPFYGRDYGIVVVGKATTADEITSTERWLSGKTGFYAPVITGVPTIGVS